MRTMSQLSSPGERERNAIMAIRVGVNMLQFCSVSNSLSFTTLSKSERYIFLMTCLDRFHCVVMFLLANVLCGYTTTEPLQIIAQNYPVRTNYVKAYRAIGLKNRVFANVPQDQGSIPGRVIPKTQNIVLDASLLNTQHYKLRINGKGKQSRESSSTSPTAWCGSYWKGSLWSPST